MKYCKVVILAPPKPSESLKILLNSATIGENIEYVRGTGEEIDLIRGFLNSN